MLTDDTPTLVKPSPFDSMLCVAPVSMSRDGVRASISDGFHPKGDTRFRGGVGHRGTDWMYRRRIPALTKAGMGHPWGSRWYRMEHGIPALCVLSGRVFRAGRLATGWHVIVEHQGGWGHAHHHLSSLCDGIEAGVSVTTGQPLGVVGGSPVGFGLVHDHLDIAHHGRFVDPARWVGKWRHLSFADAWQGHGHVSGDDLIT
jgi:murein DD-endopeptidase MepM/ murein hydrolase activator NlpD